MANTWGNAYANLDRPTQAIEKFRLSMSLSPRRSPTWWKAWSNVVSSVASIQGEEAGWREARAFLDARTRASNGEQPELRLLNNAAGTTWDIPLLLTANLADASRNGGAGACVQLLGPSIADDYGLMHDWARAQRYMAASDPDDAETKAEVLLLQAYVALDRGDGAAATTPMEAFWTAFKADPTLKSVFVDNQCLLGRAYGLAGHLGQAEALFKQAGSWARCYAFHGEALERAGDLSGAQRVWVQGLAMSPDLPFDYLVRGVSETSQGELKAAESDLATAHAKAPHFADPLKAWGDLKAREGRWKEALAKYDEALNYAPAWSDVHHARAAAAAAA